jgi:hypothetical protein
MDRTEFLQMCQKVSVLKNGLCGKKDNVPDELKVVADGIAYYPIAYKLSFNNGNPTHTAILHDIQANSLTYERLERIERYDK